MGGRGYCVILQKKIYLNFGVLGVGFLGFFVTKSQVRNICIKMAVHLLLITLHTSHHVTV